VEGLDPMTPLIWIGLCIAAMAVTFTLLNRRDS
jgi:hypothetical protein